LTHAPIAIQGRRYQLGDQAVLAMQSGLVVTVRPIDLTEPYPLGSAITVKASWLTPVGMVAFNGEVPE
jgi:hypothetical protein